MSAPPDRPERYVHAGNRALDPTLGTRTAEGSAAFLLPWLRPGHDLLDCGCAFGAITRSFARYVAPGRVVGVDCDAAQIERARALSPAGGPAPEFHAASVYALPFPDASFDAAYAGQLIWHLRQPVRALREMRRVLRPGGVVGVFDAVLGETRLEPVTPALRLLLAWEERVYRHHGAAVDNARHLPERLAEAGFARPEAGRVTYRCEGRAEARRHLPYFRARFEVPILVETILAEGWADRRELEAAWAELTAWAECGDALFVEEAAWGLGRVDAD